jgi:hypothetical protein
VALDSRIVGNIESEGGFTHRWPRREHHELALLESAGDRIEVPYSAWNARNLSVGLLEPFQVL